MINNDFIWNLLEIQVLLFLDKGQRLSIEVILAFLLILQEKNGLENRPGRGKLFLKGIIN